jgi:hypothetical protein
MWTNLGPRRPKLKPSAGRVPWRYRYRNPEASGMHPPAGPRKKGIPQRTPDREQDRGRQQRHGFNGAKGGNKNHVAVGHRSSQA